jgi:hypothetical protein
MAKKKAKVVKKKSVEKKILNSVFRLECPEIGITIIDEDYKPIVLESYIEVKAICPLLSQNNLQETLINHRQNIIFKCGVKLEIPNGFKLRCELDSAFLNLGLSLQSAYLNTDNELCIHVVNVGKYNPVSVKHRDILAKITFEPIYYLKGVKWK